MLGQKNRRHVTDRVFCGMITRSIDLTVFSLNLPEENPMAGHLNDLWPLPRYCYCNVQIWFVLGGLCPALHRSRNLKDGESGGPRENVNKSPNDCHLNCDCIQTRCPLRHHATCSTGILKELSNPYVMVAARSVYPLSFHAVFKTTCDAHGIICSAYGN